MANSPTPAITWSELWPGHWYADLGHFAGYIIYPDNEKGGYRLSIQWDNRGSSEDRVFDSLQEAQDAAIPLALSILDGWREELVGQVNNG